MQKAADRDSPLRGKDSDGPRSPGRRRGTRRSRLGKASRAKPDANWSRGSTAHRPRPRPRKTVGGVWALEPLPECLRDAPFGPGAPTPLENVILSRSLSIG